MLLPLNYLVLPRRFKPYTKPSISSNSPKHAQGNFFGTHYLPNLVYCNLRAYFDYGDTKRIRHTTRLWERRYLIAFWLPNFDICTSCELPVSWLRVEKSYFYNGVILDSNIQLASLLIIFIFILFYFLLPPSLPLFFIDCIIWSFIQNTTDVILFI